MNSAVMFSKASDEWTTPDDLFRELDEEFHFDVDAAATADNTKCGVWFTDSLTHDWPVATYWLNPPYSRCKEFLTHAARQASLGSTVVCLVPARTDTRWFHDHVYNKPNVEVRFLKGRLKFSRPNGTPIRTSIRNPGAKNPVPNNAAPFPSMVVVFRG